MKVSRQGSECGFSTAPLYYFIGWKHGMLVRNRITHLGEHEGCINYREWVGKEPQSSQTLVEKS